MLDLLNQYFLQCFINIFSGMYIISTLLNIKLDIKNYKNFFVLVIIVILSILVFEYSNNLIRLLPMTILIFISNYLIFKQSIKTTLISTIFEQFIVVISEIFAFSIVNLITKFKVEEIRDIYYGNFGFVVLISLLMISISKIKITKKIYNLFLNSIQYINIISLTFYSVLIIISINYLIASNFLEIDFQTIFAVNIFFVIAYCIILYYGLSKNNENIKYKLENEILINNLNEYEKMLDYQRINNHENKNQLLVIKSMAEKQNEKLVEYINEIIKEKREDSEVIFAKAKRIPSGGLQGLVYQKMLVMQENNIEIVLDVDANIRKINFSNITPKMNYDICRIVGIILDNAIEEAIKFNKKEREIIISMFIDESFVIEISNRIKKNLDINKIYEKGYTTKHNGHGYGLSLLSKIIRENDNILNEIRIVNNIFTQIIKIKM